MNVRRLLGFFLIFVMLSVAARAYAWPTNSPDINNPINVHPRMTYVAIQIVKEDNSKYGSILQKYEKDLLKGANDEDWLGGSITLFGKTYTIESQYHFIDPMDHAELFAVDIIGEKDTSAADKAQELYNRAIELWKEGKYDEAMWYLGRCAHILEDASMLIAHTTPHLLTDPTQYSMVVKAHDYIENNVSPGVMDDILHHRVPVPTKPIYWWQIPQEKKNFIQGEDIYLDRNEIGHMDLSHGVAWAYVDLAAHNAWRYMLYSTGKTIRLEGPYKIFGTYFWTRELKKGDWSVLKLQFLGASSITLHFADIDMQNFYGKTLGYVEIYDKNHHLIAKYAQDPNLIGPTVVTVPGDTVYIYTHVDKSAWLDNTVDGWKMGYITVHANFNINSPSDFKTFDGRTYTKAQWAVYETITFDLRLVAGLFEKFFQDVGISS